MNEQTSVDVAFTYAPEKTETYKAFNRTANAEYDITTKHSQTGVSVQLNYDF
ncbi:hypothetical protein MNB_SM-5-134 [hydrothermal vent metagenome]|uniref:Long-chain fatty acid transport protein n=1 Tax=hydrothermal vent metagenome TaxID=652676 RepID=A0A1W1BXB5_9ZZZZ